jgi:flagellin
MRINTNVSSLNALSNLNKVQDSVSSSMEKLSSGFRINKAGDDAAGLGISNQMNADIKAMEQTSRNAEQAGSVLQIMDGATSNLQSILERMKELAAQSASDTVDGPARTKIDNEFGSLTAELDRIVSTTKFQGASLLDGTYGGKTTAVGAINSTAAGSLTGAAHVASVAVTSASRLEGIVGDITASVVTSSGNTMSAVSSNAATLAVTDQATVNALTAGTLTISSVAKQTDLATGASGGVVDGTVITAIAVGSGGSDAANAAALAAGTYHVGVSTPASGGTVSLALYDASNNVVAGSATAFADNATSITFAGTGVKLTIAGSTSAATLGTTVANSNSFTVKQEYNVNITGGSPAHTQAVQVFTDDGTAQTGSFIDYGISLNVASGGYTTLNAKTITLAAQKAVKLSGVDANGAAVTQQVDFAATPAGQTLTFSSFGTSITLAAGATVANITSELANVNTQKLVHANGKTAQFLVSSSQSYTGNDLISLSGVDLRGSTLGVNRAAVDLTTGAGAQAALSTIDAAIAKVGDAIGSIGASENRIMYANQNVKTAIQNFTAAASAIKDVDMAAEMTNFSKNQILSQAGTAMLAQANQLGASVLKLLQ